MNKLCFYLIRCLIVVSVVCISARIALANSIARIFIFSGSDFSPSLNGSGPQGPVDPVFGEFTVSFDPTVTTFGSVNSFTSNLNVLRPLNYIFRPLQNFGELGVGTACDPNGCSAGSGSDDLLLDIYGAATSTPSFSQFAYSTTTGGVFEASATTLSFADVPEPSSFFMLCVGVPGLALFSLTKLARAKALHFCAHVEPFIERRQEESRRADFQPLVNSPKQPWVNT